MKAYLEKDVFEGLGMTASNRGEAQTGGRRPHEKGKGVAKSPIPWATRVGCLRKGNSVQNDSFLEGVKPFTVMEKFGTLKQFFFIFNVC